MSPVRDPTHLLLIAASATLTVALAAPAAARAQATPEAQAVAIATQAVERGGSVCQATIDPADTRVRPTDPRRATAYRPAGYDVTIGGTQGGKKYRIRGEFTSQWLVANGQAFPQNRAAARLASSCGVPPSRPKAPLDWHRLTHLEPSTGDIQVGSSMYDGAVPNTTLLRQTLDRVPLEESQGPVWAPTCKSGVQYVAFTRYVDLLGPPERLSIWVDSTSAGLRRDPVTATGVYLNRQEIALKKGRGILDVTLTEAQRRLVQFGQNRITIVARKEKTGTCNRKGGKRQVGISMSVRGKQTWQTTATRPPQQAQASALTPIPYTLTNLGPSVLLEPVFALDVAVNRVGRTVLGPDATGDRATCATTDATLTAVCGLEPMAPGEARTVNVVFAAGRTDRPPTDTGGEYTSWQVHWDFLGASGFANGAYCIPPAGQTDCRSIGAI